MQAGTRPQAGRDMRRCRCAPPAVAAAGRAVGALPGARAPPQRPGPHSHQLLPQHQRHQQRRPRCSRLHALLVTAAQQQQQQLWDYPGSRVLPASLPTLTALQRRSFGHRNPRTYVVVVADAASPACRAVEAPLEALASGLSHEPGAVVLALDAARPAAAAFAGRILNVGSLPAVLVYPEAAPGCLAYRGADMTAEGLLHAINAARLRALPGSRPYELRYGVAPLQRAVVGGGGGGGGGGGAPFALGQPPQAAQGAAQLGEPATFAPTPLAAPRAGGLWGPGRALLWGGLLGASLLAWAWDAGLDDRWEAWRLARRVRARRDGRRSFTLAENMDDILQLLLIKGARDLQQDLGGGAGDQRLGWRRLDAAGSGGGGFEGAPPAPGGFGGGAGGPVVEVVPSGSQPGVWAAAAAGGGGRDAGEPGAGAEAPPPGGPEQARPAADQQPAAPGAPPP
ncbi:MAG: hypothetical protein J3K34DRAFT_462828 [Monoraphidium minutum]|nr:MAG: hypothetical protein J3K34DRAFT_462828 [Monoraphidium minutum]